MKDEVIIMVRRDVGEEYKVSSVLVDDLDFKKAYDSAVKAFDR